MQRSTRPRDPASGEPLLKISELAERSGLPTPTIQHYLREGLLAEPAARTGRTMAWYTPTCVARLQLIRTLQHDHYLPLSVIRTMLQEGTDPRLALALAQLASAGSQDGRGPVGAHVATELTASDLAALVAHGLIARAPDSDNPPSQLDAELLELLAQARHAGLSEAVLPVAALVGYRTAVAQLVAFEVALFRDTVLRAPAGDSPAPTQAAVALSQAFVVHLRRRLLPPALVATTVTAEVA